MKHFFQVWSAWWFATMVPVHTPPTTLAEEKICAKEAFKCYNVAFLDN